MLRDVDLDAVLIATPSRTHMDMVRSALERDLPVFCEKPLTLSARDAEHLADLARRRRVVTQVGYHNRFVGSFREVKSLLDAEAIGAVTSVLGEAYGPVVLKPKGGTWRSRKAEGGGSLYDYAAHPINLLTWYLGQPIGVGGHDPEFDLFPRDRRRGLQHPLLCGRQLGAGRGQLVGRVLPEDDHADHRLGNRRANLRGPSGVPRLPQRYRPDPRRLSAGMERALHDRAHGAGRLLPSRRGVQRPDRSLRRAGEDRSGERPERVRQRRGHRQGHRDDARRCSQGSVDAHRRGGHRAGPQAVATIPSGMPGVSRPMSSDGSRQGGRARMDRLLFGDNQFFGVNHMSEEKARAQALRFQDRWTRSIDVLDAAYDEGIRTFMCTTHDRIAADLRPRASASRTAMTTSRSIPACPMRTSTRTR